ncbi:MULTISPECIES: FAD-binding oxidoreductase [Subtercola]|uniref:FAD-binding oxidoreductase n=1 Tax=Subtercola vilae TaxID=2056433 RepID=A0A4T2C4N9_9MICO|nr:MULTISPECIES: FAD-binding oxidoreductase [Subtercola]MEA9984715.1 FAD-binding oxidoreductase [Subtercola sp. RTI3]TIH39040.1 FAD-binding oxidoreductase [Subtercola vilae]
MTDVKHMKWWGWGVEGVGFHHEDKPGFAPFVVNAVGIDVWKEPVPPIDFAEVNVPESVASDEFFAALTTIVGPEYATTDGLERVVHTYGKSIRDLIRLRDNVLPRVPDVVVYPADESAVQRIMALAVAEDAVIIPFGGGSNIVGSLEPVPTETRTIISLDMGRMSRVLDIDEYSNLATIQAGVLGPDMEEQLNARGWTLGHFPDSFTHSTLGGWIATRSSGMQSDKYGDIADMTKGLRVVQPGKLLVVRPIPASATGPSVREAILGSEGRLGIITEATVQVHRLPAKREVLGYLFKNWDSALAAMHDIATSDAAPSITRVSDARETAFSFSTSKASHGISGQVQKALFAFLQKRGWNLDEVCLSFIGYEGTASNVSHQKSVVGDVLKKHGAITLGKGPGALYDQKKFDTPYLRDFLLDRGAAADVSETAAPWAKLKPLYDNVFAAANKAYAEIGMKGWIMCHLSHSMHSGACLYFTFAFTHDGVDPIAQYDVVKSAIQQAFIDNGGTLSHHHSVGVEHARWIEDDISTAGADLVQGMFTTVDPGKNLNPGKILTRE